jgi:signal transduction histidine kinase/CheY-like chemotaxis protein
MDALGDIEIPLGETFVGRAAVAGQVRQAPDLAAEEPDAHIDELMRHGWRSMVAVPLRHEDEIVGMLTVRRKTEGAVAAHTISLLETLAGQSAVAIHNARLFRELQSKTAQLEVASRHKSEFLASMSHELRTPLNAVIGFSDVLLDRMFGELNDRQAEYIQDIRDSGRHLLELINEILDLSRIEAGRMDLDVGVIDMVPLLNQCLGMVRDRADQHGIEVALEVDATLEPIEGDERKLKQVVLNLLSNAVKFTPDGGAVAMRATAGEGEVIVAVSDTGPGVAPADRERIFAAFQRGDRAARGDAEGTGLGLTLSRRIVDLHGGRLWLEDAPGGGSRFSFAVPACPSHRAAPDDIAPGEAAAVDVLVIEDDRRSADLLRVYLEDAGYSVTTAADGPQGIDAARQRTPSVVLLDLGLPGMSGWEVLAQLKGDQATAGVPVVIVSMLDEHGAGFALGAAEYLVKPVSQDTLLDAIRRCTPAPGGTVVTIDDDPVALDLAEAALVPAGWSVVRAADGAEGVAAVRRSRPDVVILDLLMPGLDGFAVVERLRSDPDLADVPIIVMSAKDLSRVDRARLEGKVNHLAAKGSLRQSELADLVERMARRGQRLQEAP